MKQIHILTLHRSCWKRSFDWLYVEPVMQLLTILILSTDILLLRLLALYSQSKSSLFLTRWNIIWRILFRQEIGHCDENTLHTRDMCLLRTCDIHFRDRWLWVSMVTRPLKERNLIYTYTILQTRRVNLLQASSSVVHQIHCHNYSVL